MTHSPDAPASANLQTTPPTSGETISLTPGLPQTIQPESHLVGADKLTDEFGVGFTGTLRTIVSGNGTNHEQGEKFYIFDRGPQTEDSIEPIVSTDMERVVVLLRPKDRYVVMTQKGVDQMRDTHQNQRGIRSRSEWQTYDGGTELTIGRNADTVDELRTERISPTLSRQHFNVKFGEDGTITVTDLHSTNGTSLVVGGEVQAASGFEPAPTYTPDEILPTHPSNETKLMRVSHLLGRKATNSWSKEVGEFDRNAVRSAVRMEKLKGEDTVLERPDIATYGVFDGVGGEENGALASKLAADTVAESIAQGFSMQGGNLSHFTAKDKEYLLKAALEDAHRMVITKAGGGATTAAVAQLHKHGNKHYAIWASIGDSRIYAYNRFSQEIQQITKDEIASPERAHVITNALGISEFGVRQSGHFELKEGDQLMLCSDGITGDYAPDLVGNNEIAGAMHRARNADQAADNVMALARKRDDRSVLIVG